MNTVVSGKCECGKVEFTVDSPREAITVCHCSQCRRTSGHLWASTHAPYDQLTFKNDEGLEWYASSDTAKRGFCRYCGSSLFYRMNNEDGIGIAAGCLDDSTGMYIGKHIFVSNKGEYYAIRDDAPQIDTF